MSKRYVGQSSQIESNAAPAGQIQGSQVGGMLPGTLESLQEAPCALDTNTLYYEEALGSFLAPSFQRQYGIKNETVQNVDGWGQVGTFSVDNDIFWNGPAAITIRVPLKPRWYGTECSGQFAQGSFMKPSFFYSWGAGYAAVKQFRFNMGGAGQYTLDRYANYIGVFMSCFSTMQRFALMKLAGGGVIAESPGLETGFGLGRSTATFGTVPSHWFGGFEVGAASPYNGKEVLLPRKVRVPIEDNWVVAIKTPHTNYQNPRVRRRPLDSKLFSEPFNVDFTLANFDEICDSGVGLTPIRFGGDAALKYKITPDTPIIDNAQASVGTYSMPQNHRQYGYIYGSRPVIDAAADIKIGNYDGTDYVSYFNDVNAGLDDLFPTTENAIARAGPLLGGPDNMPVPSINTLVSSMRLTNDMLGAYDVLKTRTDQAVYYPFQHFTTQIYFTQNTQYGDMTLADYIDPTDSTFFPSNERSALQPIRATVNIPVNPMTAMYVGILREKDRQGLGISTLGGYSPCLFWNFLHLPYLELSYGAEPLIRYDTAAEYLSEQMYEHCSAIQIPYKGGFCLQSESTIGSAQSGAIFRTGTGVVEPSSTGVYNGILRNAWVYELSLVEMEPLRNEAFFQQTPSFQGEQLNLSFRIEPSTLAFGVNYNPFCDYSYIDNYSGFQGGIENKTMNTPSSDVIGARNMLTAPAGALAGVDYFATGYANTEKGGPAGTRKVDVWHMNNDRNLMVVVIYAQNALWQLNPNMSKMVFARG